MTGLNDFTSTSGTIAGLPIYDFRIISYTGIDAILNNALTQDKLPNAFPPGSGQLQLTFLNKTSTDGFILVNGTLENVTITNLSTSNIPIPGAVWLFGSGLLGLLRWNRKSKVARKPDFV